MASVNQTRPHCVNQMGKTHSEPLAARHGRGKAWARHAMCESALSQLSDAARHRPSICYPESRTGPVRITYSDIITSAMYRICPAELRSRGIPSMRDGFSSQPCLGPEVLAVFSGWGVGRLALLGVTATFRGPFTLPSKLTPVELVEGLNMWKRGRERNRYTTLSLSSPPPKSFWSNVHPNS